MLNFFEFGAGKALSYWFLHALPGLTSRTREVEDCTRNLRDLNFIHHSALFSPEFLRFCIFLVIDQITFALNAPWLFVKTSAALRCYSVLVRSSLFDPINFEISVEYVHPRRVSSCRWAPNTTIEGAFGIQGFLSCRRPFPNYSRKWTAWPWTALIGSPSPYI